MFDFHEKRKIRSLLYSKVTIAVLFMLVALLSISVFERFKVEREMAARRDAKQTELLELRARASVLESKVEHLNESRGVEEELRSRFDVAKEGEEVVIIIDDTTPVNGATGTNALGTSTGTLERRSWFDILKFW